MGLIKQAKGRALSWYGRTRAKLIGALRKQIEAHGISPAWTGSVWSGGAYVKAWDSSTAIEEGLESTIWVYACVTAISQAVSSLEWNAYRVAEDGTYGRLPDSDPLAALLARPNNHQDAKSFWEYTVLMLLLTGNSMTVELHAEGAPSGLPVAMQTVRSDKLSPVPGDWRKHEQWIKHYKWSSDVTGLPNVPTQDLIHCMFPDPASDYWGMSPMRAGAATIATDEAATDWNMYAMDNRVSPSGILSATGPNGEPLTDKQWNQFRQQVYDQHQQPQNAREPFVVGADVTWTSLGMTAEDMDFINGRRMTREEICALFRVPPPVVGIQDTATYNNVAQAWLRFYLDTVFPVADRLASAFTQFLARRFGADLAVGYERVGVQALSAQLVEYADTYVKLWGTGVPPVIIAQVLGLDLPRFAGDTIGWIAGGLVPVSTLLEQSGAADEAEEQPADEAVQVDEAASALDDMPSRMHKRLEAIFKPLNTGKPRKPLPGGNGRVVL